MNSLNRNDCLVDFGCEPQGAINYFTPRQLDSSKGLEACIPSPRGEHATGTNVFLRTVQLNRLTLQESALPFQVWTEHSSHGIIRKFASIPLPGEGGYSLSLSGTAPQPGSSRGLEACIPSPYGEHAAGTNVFLRIIQLNRLTLQESALPFQVWTEHSLHGIIRRFSFIPLPGQGVFTLTSDKPGDWYR